MCAADPGPPTACPRPPSTPHPSHTPRAPPPAHLKVLVQAWQLVQDELVQGAHLNLVGRQAGT